ncbi:MAG TPA: formyltetrahydrofolate deformylase [Thermoanaerobaculia bacterium]|nr:formyltetrahydrofolate deformylase [Thermoanaerobaculia bacterium]
MSRAPAESDTSRAAILLLTCPLRLGLAARLTEFVYSHGGRILYHDQYVDGETTRYFTRLKWDLAGFAAADAEIGGLVGEIVRGCDAEWSLHFSDERLRMAIFVSKDPACLYDLLARSHSGEWNVEVPIVVSNHPDLADAAERFGVEFRAFDVTAENRRAVEEEQRRLLRERRVDFVVLARYMQIVSEGLVEEFPNRIINIHHAFLPAFPGARPYHAARARGVKMIGATSHYVTAQLDAGPIIEQDVLRVSHRHMVGDLIRLGRDLEKTVLARAVWSHIRRRIIVHGGRTVVFD